MPLTLHATLGSNAFDAEGDYTSADLFALFQIWATHVPAQAASDDDLSVKLDHVLSQGAATMSAIDDLQAKLTGFIADVKLALGALKSNLDAAQGALVAAQAALAAAEANDSTDAATIADLKAKVDAAAAASDAAAVQLTAMIGDVDAADADLHPATAKAKR